MYPRCRSRVFYHHSNVVCNRMPIKLVDGYSKNHVEGHEWPGWNLPLLHIRRNWGQIPSRSLMSLNMILGVPINQLYSHPIRDNVWVVPSLFKFILIYLLYVLFVLKIEGIFGKKIQPKNVERGNFLYI